MIRWAHRFNTAMVGLWLLAGALPVRAAEPPGQDGYPLRLTRGSRLMIDARVNGRPVSALLDSAAEATIIDSGVAQSLKLSGGTTATGQGSGEANFEATLIKGVQLQALGLTLENQTVATADLTDVGQRLLRQKLQVILGREIFDAARLRVDIDGRRIRVLQAGSAPVGVKLDLVTEHGIETLPVRVEGHDPVRATFDLGNGAEVLIGSQLAERLHLLSDGRQVSKRAGGGLGGALQRQVVRLRSLEVAGKQFTDVEAAVDPRPSASDVNIGVRILRRFLITTDFANHAVWLEPRS
jgi:predicted aspartyl protease